ncbi:hypothetical protein F3Y22_tig00002841pilonHSYRG00216 [Hibiscus syriacus]|uniref:Pentatricopeptide repeat-containing protein n=1 Tax=Hibiscus syriacus TaxID=106335 RepID=A0A6A3CV22_HIBSY|nr:hypothetical protein F3Y22_tig00002841pilonHSYRG00216 [Hibiscus syriacus]
MNIRLEESTFRLLVYALCRMNKVGYALGILQRMIDDGLGVCDKVFSFVLSSICAQGDLDGEDVMGFWRESRKLGFSPAMGDYILADELFDEMLMLGEILEAFVLVEEVLHKCHFHEGLTFDEVICGLCQRGLVCKALEFVGKMVVKNISPGARAWEALLLSLKLDSKFSIPL